MNVKNSELIVKPDDNGFYGIYGGEAENVELRVAMNEIKEAFHNAIKDSKFHEEMIYLYPINLKMHFQVSGSCH